MLDTLKQWLKHLLAANFFLAAAVLVLGGFSSLSDALSWFDFNSELSGALGNSLRIMLLYLALAEVAVLMFCFVSGSFRPTLFVGVFLLFLIGPLAFYGEVNTVAIDEKLAFFFLYTGVSHGLYGLWAYCSGGHYD